MNWRRSSAGRQPGEPVMVLSEMGGHHIATFYGPEAEKNAHVGAAAPDLLAVAQDWLSTMEADEYECTCEPDDVCPLCRCKAAIAKARRKR